MIFAIAAEYLYNSDGTQRGDIKDHLFYLTRARMLSMGGEYHVQYRQPFITRIRSIVEEVPILGGKQSAVDDGVDAPGPVQMYWVPPRHVADHLFETYLRAVHPHFPWSNLVIGMIFRRSLW
jgi:hypothetical protein